MDFESRIKKIKKNLDKSNFKAADLLISEFLSIDLDFEESGTLYYYSGLSAFYQKNHKLAEQEFTKSLELRLISNETKSDLFKIAEAYYSLSLVYYKMGKLQKSIDACLESVMMENSLTEEAELFGKIYYLLAKSSHKQAYLTKAKIYYKEALYYFNDLEIPYLRASVLLSYGILYLNYKLSKKANELFYKALWIAKRNNYLKLIAKSVMHISEAYFTSEDKENIGLQKPLAYEMELFQPNDPLVNIVRHTISAFNSHLREEYRRAKNYWNSILFSDVSSLDSRYFFNAFHKYRTFSTFKLWVKTLSKEDGVQFINCLRDWSDYCSKEKLTNYLIEILIIESKFCILNSNFDIMIDKLNLALSIAKISGLTPQENLISNVMKNSERVKQEILLNLENGLPYPLNYRMVLQQEIEIYFKDFHGVLTLSI